MKLPFLLSCACATLFSTGCTSHLVFMEESHTGLKIAIGGGTPSPYDISLGYRRGVIAAVPKQRPSSNTGSTSVPATTHSSGTGSTVGSDEGGEAAQVVNGDKKTVVIKYDPNELMNLYSDFCTNIGFGDPIEYHHFMVTGEAAVRLTANKNALNELTQVMTTCNRELTPDIPETQPPS